MAASVARIAKPAGPECCRYSGRMSGVFTKKLGRMYAAAGPASSLAYSSSSARLLRQVKYV